MVSSEVPGVPDDTKSSEVKSWAIIQRAQQPARASCGTWVGMLPSKAVLLVTEDGCDACATPDARQFFTRRRRTETSAATVGGDISSECVVARPERAGKSLERRLEAARVAENGREAQMRFSQNHVGTFTWSP